MTEERRVPQWIQNEEQYMKIKREIQLLKYQIQFFNKGIRDREKRMKYLEETRDKRIKSYGLKYHTREELDEAYIVGSMTDDEYRKQRVAIWNVYSDRGHIAELKWMTEERDKAQRKLDEINKWREERHKEACQRKKKKRLKKMKHATAWRRYNRRKRRQALEERWRRYGIG